MSQARNVRPGGPDSLRGVSQETGGSDQGGAGGRLETEAGRLQRREREPQRVGDLSTAGNWQFVLYQGSVYQLISFSCQLDIIQCLAVRERKLLIFVFSL